MDWNAPANTKVSGPGKMNVVPYHFLCNGQITSCVPQPGTEKRLDAQGDKLMQRVVYRKIGKQESIVAAHSVATSAGGGEFAGTSSGSIGSGIRISTSRAPTRLTSSIAGCPALPCTGEATSELAIRSGHAEFRRTVFCRPIAS